MGGGPSDGTASAIPPGTRDPPHWPSAQLLRQHPHCPRSVPGRPPLPPQPAFCRASPKIIRHWHRQLRAVPENSLPGPLEIWIVLSYLCTTPQGRDAGNGTDIWVIGTDRKVAFGHRKMTGKEPPKIISK